MSSPDKHDCSGQEHDRIGNPGGDSYCTRCEETWPPEEARAREEVIEHQMERERGFHAEIAKLRGEVFLATSKLKRIGELLRIYEEDDEMEGPVSSSRTLLGIRDIIENRYG